MAGRGACCNDFLGTSFDARQWLSLNPCGFFGISCSFAVHLFAFTTVGWHLISGSFLAQAVYLLVYFPLAIMAIWSLFMAWTTDPGAVPLGARPLVTVSRAASGDLCPSTQARKRGLRRCQKCNDNYKPNRAHHDSVSGRCIVKFDHYCPWVGNAVGALNHKFFVLFVFYTMNTCMVSLFLIVIRSIRCGYVYDDDVEEDALSDGNTSNTSSSEDNMDTTEEVEEVEGELDQGRRQLQAFVQRLLESKTPKYVHEECEDFYQAWSIIILFCIAITFLIFTGCMMVEQIEAIQTNQGKIARMKMRVGQGGTELSRVTEEFNEMFGGTTNSVAWHWFVPLPVQFPNGMHKVVMGYEWDPTFDPLPYREDEDEADDTSGNTTTSTTELTASENSELKDGERIIDEPPRDLETGLPQDDLDEVSVGDSSVHSSGSMKLKKRPPKSVPVPPVV